MSRWREILFSANLFVSGNSFSGGYCSRNMCNFFHMQGSRGTWGPKSTSLCILRDIYVPNCWVDLSFNLRVNLDFFLFWFCKLQNRPKVFGCNLKSIDCSRFHSNNTQFDEKKKSGINLALKLKSTHHLGT